MGVGRPLGKLNKEESRTLTKEQVKLMGCKRRMKTAQHISALPDDGSLIFIDNRKTIQLSFEDVKGICIGYLKSAWNTPKSPGRPIISNTKEAKQARENMKRYRQRLHSNLC